MGRSGCSGVQVFYGNTKHSYRPYKIKQIMTKQEKTATLNQEELKTVVDILK